MPDLHAIPSFGTMVAKPRITYVGSYPPRECGIATFTRDLCKAIDHLSPLVRTHIVAMQEQDAHYAYPSEVKATITRDDLASYRLAAQHVNQSRTQVVSVQHEFGLFGGEYGSHLLAFMRNVDVPISVTMHTVLRNPQPAMRQVVRDIATYASRIVVLAEQARAILQSDYGLSPSQVSFIPHGVPTVRRVPSSHFKRTLGLDHRTVVSTFGLVGPGKGIEYVLDALPAVVERHPSLTYLILGETHPGVRKHEGERYRESLAARVASLGLENHVQFHNRYLTYRELVHFLLASDVYVVPNLDPHQIASGTLAYAVGCGRAVVSTPFVYAREMLGNGRGLLTEFRDADSTAQAINQILDNPFLRASMEQRAYTYARRMTWPAVAREYLHTFHEISAPAPMPLAIAAGTSLASPASPYYGA
jgi:glycosyltransferase involved in cell wall biosynthesis